MSDKKHDQPHEKKVAQDQPSHEKKVNHDQHKQVDDKLTEREEKREAGEVRPVNPPAAADARDQGEVRRDEQLAHAARGGDAGAGLANEHIPQVVHAPPDSPLVQPTNNADPPIAPGLWNPPQRTVAEAQQTNQLAQQAKKDLDAAQARGEKIPESVRALVDQQTRYWQR